MPLVLVNQPRYPPAVPGSQRQKAARNLPLGQVDWPGLTASRQPATWIRAMELAPGGRHANRSVTVFVRASPSWLGCSAVALSGEVHDGRGAELLRSYRPGPARRPAVRHRGPLHGEGWGSQEPEEVGQLLRLPGRLRPAAADGRKGTPGSDNCSGRG